MTKPLKSVFNFHTHTEYCDGTSNIIDFLKNASDLGFLQLGFSSHAPLYLKNIKWTIIDDVNLNLYSNKIDSIKAQMSDLQVFKGLEADYLPGISKDFRFFKKEYNLDYLIGAVHLVAINNSFDLWFIDGNESDFRSCIKKYFDNDGKKATLKYYNQLKEMIINESFDIIAHFDKIKMNNKNVFFSEDDKWYKSEVFSVLELIKKHDVIMEVNTRGYYKKKTIDFFPSDWIIKEAIKSKIKIIVSSDAHHFSELTKGIALAYNKLQQLGCKEVIVRKDNQWIETDIQKII